MDSLLNLLTDLMMAVGPNLSAPCVGLIPSDRGAQASLPFADAPVISPIGVLLEMERVPWEKCEYNILSVL